MSNRSPTARRSSQPAQKARRNGKTIVVVKSGDPKRRKPRRLPTRAALAGNIAVFDAFAREAGIIRVDNLEDLIEAATFRRPWIARAAAASP